MEHNEKKKVIPAINERYYFIPAFFAGCLFMYLFLSFSGLLTSGKYCMLSSDSLEIYVPNIREMCRNILNGENIYYSWSHSMGMNMSLSLAFYGAFNPFNLLYLIFFHADPNIITAVIVILKTGLAAMTFQLFSSRGLKITNFSSVFFALFYSMCSFQVSFDVVNFIWMDALYMFPLCIPGAADPVTSFSTEDREQRLLRKNDKGNKNHSKRCHNGQDRIKTCFVERIRKDSGYYTSACPVSSADREILRYPCTAFVAAHCHEMEEHTHGNKQHNKADHLSDDHAVSFVRYVKCGSSEQGQRKDVSHETECPEQGITGKSSESAAPAENAHEQYD